MAKRESAIVIKKNETVMKKTVKTRKNPFFASNVKTLRKHHNFTVEQLGEAIGLSPTALRDIERGEVASPGFIHVARIGRLFGVDPHQLFEESLSDVSRIDLALNYIEHQFSEEDWEYLYHHVDVRRKMHVKAGRFKNLLVN